MRFLRITVHERLRSHPYPYTIVVKASGTKVARLTATNSYNFLDIESGDVRRLKLGWQTRSRYTRRPSISDARLLFSRWAHVPFRARRGTSPRHSTTTRHLATRSNGTHCNFAPCARTLVQITSLVVDGAFVVLHYGCQSRPFGRILRCRIAALKPADKLVVILAKVCLPWVTAQMRHRDIAN